MGVRIHVDGRELPCRATLGAMLAFRRETGREVTEIAEGAVSDLVTYLWCCVASACRADGVEFGLGLDEFADRLDGEDLAAWSASLTGGGQDAGGSVDEKKSV